MSITVESGIQVDLTGKHHFRFQNLAAYQSISGQYLKEMDYCWLDNNKLIMLELKNYADEVAWARQENTTYDQFIEYLINKTAPKIWDSLLMFAACWLPTNKGSEFRLELDTRFHERVERIGVVIIMAVPNWFKPHFYLFKNRLRKILQGKLALFDSTSLIVCMPDQLPDTPFAACLTPVEVTPDQQSTSS